MDLYLGTAYTQTNLPLKQEASDAKRDYRNGCIDRDTFIHKCKPYIDQVNCKGKTIAQRYGKRWTPFTWKTILFTRWF